MIRRNKEFNESKVCIMRGDDTGPGDGGGTVYRVKSGKLNRKRNISGICKIGDLRITGDTLA